MSSDISPKCLNGTVFTQRPLDLMKASLPSGSRNRLPGDDPQRAFELSVLVEECCDAELALRCNLFQSDLLS